MEIKAGVKYDNNCLELCWETKAKQGLLNNKN